MKTCPFCQSLTFDDMEVCYGCMHRFEPPANNVNASASVDAGGPALQQQQEGPAAQPAAGPQPPQLPMVSIQLSVYVQPYSSLPLGSQNR
jgi:hypothetical protein